MIVPLSSGAYLGGFYSPFMHCVKNNLIQVGNNVARRYALAPVRNRTCPRAPQS